MSRIGLEYSKDQTRLDVDCEICGKMFWVDANLVRDGTLDPRCRKCRSKQELIYERNERIAQTEIAKKKPKRTKRKLICPKCNEKDVMVGYDSCLSCFVENEDWKS